MERREWLKKMGWVDVPFSSVNSTLPEECIVGFGEIKDKLRQAMEVDAARYVFISGMFGYGKSTLLRWIEQESTKSKNALVLRFSGPPTSNEIVAHINYLYEPRSIFEKLTASVKGGPRLPRTVHDVPDFLNSAFPDRPKVFLVDELQTAFDSGFRNGLDELKKINDDTKGLMVIAGLVDSQRRLPESILERGLETIALRPLDLNETTQLISTRIQKVAKGTANPFDAETIRVIHEASAGCPRQINELCRLAIVKQMEIGATIVSTADVAAVGGQIGMPQVQITGAPEVANTRQTPAVRKGFREKISGTAYASLSDSEIDILQYIAATPGLCADEIAGALNKPLTVVRTYLGYMNGNTEDRKVAGIPYPIIERSGEKPYRYRIGVFLNKVIGEM